MKIAIIPARSGSKRILDKNIKGFCGKPIITWPIQAAKASGLFDHIIVSTDDEEIAKVARCCGAEVPFLRPFELSDDYTGTTEVVGHATHWALEQGWQIDMVCCIYPCAVFVRSTDLKAGFEAITSGAWNYSFSAVEYTTPIFRSFQRMREGGVEMFFPENFAVRSQDLPQALHDAGQYYWGRPEAWLENRMVFSKYSIPVIMSHRRVIDIDTQEDWDWAEKLFAFLSVYEQ